MDSGLSLKDPFNGRAKATLAGVVYVFQLMNWLSTGPFLCMFIFAVHALSALHP